MTAETVKIIRKRPMCFFAMWAGFWDQAIYVYVLYRFTLHYFMFYFAAEEVFFQTTACGEAVPFIDISLVV